jgi:uncharacterized protein YhaN
VASGEVATLTKEGLEVLICREVKIEEWRKSKDALVRETSDQLERILAGVKEAVCGKGSSVKRLEMEVGQLRSERELFEKEVEKLNSVIDSFQLRRRSTGGCGCKFFWSSQLKSEHVELVSAFEARSRSLCKGEWREE